MLDWKTEVRGFLAGLKLDAAQESEIVEEFSQHLNDRYEDLLSSGISPEEARRTLIAELRNGKLAERLRPVVNLSRPSAAPLPEERGNVLGALVRDLHYATRLLRLNPSFAIVAALSLALGIGANSAIFQLLDAVRLRTLPVKDPQQLADVRIVYAPNGRTGAFTSHNPQLTNALWEQIRDRQQGFSNIAAWSTQRMNLRQGGEARYANGLWVSGTFFEILGVRPILGRLISQGDDHRGCGSSGAVISYSFWQQEFGGEPSVLGKTITLEGKPFEVIGVTPTSFFGVEVGRNFDVALPVCAEPIVDGEEERLNSPQAWWLASIGRLRPGWSLGRVSDQLAAISPGIFSATLPSKYDSGDRSNYLKFKLGAIAAASGVSSLRREYETPLLLLMAICGMVLLIACANLANLMMARASARQREMAVRLALGASRCRLISQLMTESFLIAILGALCGAAIAQILSRILVAFLSTQNTHIFLDLKPDWRVLTFTVGLALLACLLFGLTPALKSAHIAPIAAMKSGGRGLTGGRERFGFRQALVISQVSLSLVLLVGALLFIRTFRNLLNVDAGFHADHILITRVDLTALNLPPERRTVFKQQLLAQLRAVPEVTAAADSTIVPAIGEGWNDNIDIKDVGVVRALVNFDEVSSGYFRTLETPLLAGRDFSEEDTSTSPPVAIVTEQFAKKFLAGANPVGKTFKMPDESGRSGRIYQIVGLVRDIKYEDLHDAFSPIAFVDEAQDQHPNPEVQVMIRSEGNPDTVISAVRSAIAQISPTLVIDFRIFKTTIRDSLLRERLMATLAAFCGVLASTLAAIGLYGVISYIVVRRTNEIGIRMALGATRRRILTVVTFEIAKLLIVGLVIGSVLALAVTPAVRSLLYGLRPNDPLTFVAATAGLATVSMAASLVPALRASRLHPMLALRDE
jgi:putative ABC transport system permease protein